MITMQLTVSDFFHAFEQHGRGGQFSRGALEALYEYLEQNNYVLDVIDLCTTYAESDLDDLINEHDLIDWDNYEDQEDAYEAALEELNQRTTVIYEDSEGYPDGATMVLYFDF